LEEGLKIDSVESEAVESNGDDVDNGRKEKLNADGTELTETTGTTSGETNESVGDEVVLETPTEKLQTRSESSIGMSAGAVRKTLVSNGCFLCVFAAMQCRKCILTRGCLCVSVCSSVPIFHLETY
uniref:HIT-type domain-containing protein n=1 Tax=Gongylonema pulchrum TaxID=637853 RepID=A0A183DH31_9BILA